MSKKLQSIQNSNRILSITCDHTYAFVGCVRGEFYLEIHDIKNTKYTTSTFKSLKDLHTAMKLINPDMRKWS